MAIHILGISGEPKDGLLVEARSLLERCGRRYQPQLTLLPPAKGRAAHDEQSAMLDEGDRLLTAARKASSRACLIALDAAGKVHDSAGFSAAVESILSSGRTPIFVVGGAAGHSQKLLAEADEKWSLSPLTFPHRLALLVVAEQVYRSHEMVRGGPYAK